MKNEKRFKNQKFKKYEIFKNEKNQKFKKIEVIILLRNVALPLRVVVPLLPQPVLP